MFQQLVDSLSEFWDWIVDGMVNISVSILSAIPVPDFINQISVNGNNIGGQTAYYLGILRFDEGIVIILGALVTRFIFKRIPFIN